jgi:hypothetical protein
VDQAFQRLVDQRQATRPDGQNSHRRSRQSARAAKDGYHFPYRLTGLGLGTQQAIDTFGELSISAYQ